MVKNKYEKDSYGRKNQPGVTFGLQNRFTTHLLEKTSKSAS